MKTLFLEAKWMGKIELDKGIMKKLPAKLGLIASVQFVEHLDKIKNKLVKNGKKVFFKKGNQKYKGQVLGCDFSSVDVNADAILYIGDGSFHPLGAALKTGKQVFCFNPINKGFSKIDKKDVEDYNKKKKAAYMKFLGSDKVGVLVSLKPGQNRLKEALKLKKRFKDKEFYYFVFDTLNPEEIENFPFIEAWVNSACPRIFDGFLCVNIEDI